MVSCCVLRNLMILNMILTLKAYAETARSQWVKDWPGQAVLCTSQIFWTFEVNEAIKAHPNVGFYTLFSPFVFLSNAIIFNAINGNGAFNVCPNLSGLKSSNVVMVFFNGC